MILNRTFKTLFICLFLFQGLKITCSQGSEGSDKGYEFTPTPIELDIKTKQSSDKYQYQNTGNTGTYETNPGYGFSKVRTQRVQIWLADVSDYSTKVVVQGIGDKKKTVTIHLKDNKTKTFHRDGQNKPWQEIIKRNQQTPVS